MKWSVVGLFALGVVAAVSAVLLVLSLQSSDGLAAAGPETAEAPPAIVQVQVASRDLAPGELIEVDDLKTEEIELENKPDGAFSSPSPVIGKVLATPVKEGEIVLSRDLARDGSGWALASALQPGLRAMSVSLSDTMGMENHLYPGAVVDVLTAIRVEEESGSTENVSVTILENISVLAVGNSTVVAPEKGEEKSQNRRPSVTLLVSPEQAEMLKLAMETGSVSVALRNPTDTGTGQADGAHLAKLSPVFASIAAAKREAYLRELQDADDERARAQEKQEYEMEMARYAIEREREEIEIARRDLERRLHEADTALEEVAPQWRSVLIRGGLAEEKTFNLPKGNGEVSKSDGVAEEGR